LTNIPFDEIDKITTHQALEALDALTQEAGILRHKIIEDGDITGNDTEKLASLTRDVVQRVSIHAAFLDVCEFRESPERLAERLQTSL
jgi:hypothetical protein